MAVMSHFFANCLKTYQKIGCSCKTPHPLLRRDQALYVLKISISISYYKKNFFCSYFFQVETELIDKLDILVSENKGDEDYKILFNQM